MGTRSRSLTSWLLLIAFLHALLAPTVGMAMGKDAFARTTLLQLCTMDGSKFVEVDLSDGEATGAVSAAEHGGVCLLCFSPATPPDTGAAAFRSAAPDGPVPNLDPDDPKPRRATAWRPDFARAPPADA